jgi:uncharacterized protein
MEQPFLILYNYFNKRKTAFWLSFVMLMVILGWGASRIELEEDISKFFPDDKRVEKLNYIFKNSKLSERLVVMVSVKDSASIPQPDNLVLIADTLINKIDSKLSTHISKIKGKIDDAGMLEILNSVQSNLPIYLTDEDYQHLDSLALPEVAQKILLQNYKQLISPSGMVMKNVIVKDPLGISFPVLKRLQHLQYDENFELYENYILTKDHRHLLFFIEPVYPANETRRNAQFQKELNELIAESGNAHPEIMTSYFGASRVAVGNAKQLQTDTILTVSVMLILLLVILLVFFRKKRIPFLILLPVLFGALFALSVIALFKGSLSILALAVGAVILGVAIDYPLHFLVHLKEERNTANVIRHLAKPLTIGSLTTVFAFLCLQFTNAAVLQDIGLFSALSLVGAAFFSLTVLPHLIQSASIPSRTDNWLDRITSFSFESKKGLVYAILVITPLLLYFATEVKFNSDMGRMNFMNKETHLANERLENINKASLSSIYVVASAVSMEGALRANEKTQANFADLEKQRLVKRVMSVSSFLVSDSLQRRRIEKWNSYWTADRRVAIRNIVQTEGTNLHFSPVILRNLDSLISKKYEAIQNDTSNIFRSLFYADYIIEKNNTATVISLLQTEPENKGAIYKNLEGKPATAFDKQMLTNLFVEYVHADFNYIVTVTSMLVFLALLISYGRIELTLMTFVPMFFSWIWILGIMALLGIEFNIINVMVSTFVFGLGDDYSIFIMDGLQQEYRSGRKSLPSIRTSIFLSALTTICGLGVLVFAKHPALKSIAAISIIGIFSVFLMSQVLEPFFFRTLISDRAKKGLPPITFVRFCNTVFTYGFFVFGSFFLTIVGLLLKLIPFQRSKVRLFFHTLISLFNKALIYSTFNLKKRFINKTSETFSRSSVIVVNHSSFLDILLTTMLHPKLILLTNKWVYNSPVFGGVVRLADYYPVMDGVEDSVSRVKDRVAEGYSIVVFPEGTRSDDGKLRRFHKGAFYMADQLQLPVRPLLIHGAYEGIKKGDMYLNDSTLTLKFLSPVEPSDKSFGENYSERTKNISRYFRGEFMKLKSQKETPEFFVYKLITNYVYKGPVLEWYLRIKLRLEKNYEAFHQLIPMKASILDLGCGYGFLGYMLQFLSEERIITGVDYDEEKIETAQNGYLKSSRLNFYCGDVTQYPLEKYDVIIMSDVLHYLNSVEQEDLISRCFGALNKGGKMIIRDGNRDLQERHKGTQLTELFSVKLLRFNKSRNELNFISGTALKELAHRHGLLVQIQDETKYTSNVIFVISKQEEVHAAV